MQQSILSISANQYQPSVLHTQERDWAETNCYVDIWIELLHALGYEPKAALAFTLGIDFEGDQWTFFKFPFHHLKQLFALDVQELAVWRPLAEHINEQIALGRPVLVELDSFYLPDTQGTAYQTAHVKSTVAVNMIDLDKRELGYFHGQSYYTLEGNNFNQVLRLDCDDDSKLPPYIEIVKRRPQLTLTGDALVEQSFLQLKEQLNWMPEKNPFDVFAQRLDHDLPWLKEQNLEVFHHYSFATLRQLGACFELSSNYLNWLTENSDAPLNEIADGFAQLSQQAKAYQFQLARTVSRKKPLDRQPIAMMAELWHSLINQLVAEYS